MILFYHLRERERNLICNEKIVDSHRCLQKEKVIEIEREFS
jgi:hypothetical protein